MERTACACGEPISRFGLTLPPDYEKGRIECKCLNCEQRYAFVMPEDLSRTILPPVILETQWEGGVIVVTAWRDSDGHGAD